MFDTWNSPESGARPDSIIVIPVRGWELSAYGINDGDLLTVDKNVRPYEGQLALIRYDGGELIAAVTFGGTSTILLLSTPYEVLVLTLRDNPVIVGTVTGHL